MASTGKRIGVFGATGALGSEVLAALDASSIRVAGIVPFASEQSLGEDVEFQGELAAVRTEAPNMAGLDLVFLCAPPAVSLDAARAALHAEVPAIDLSGALSLTDDVPLRAAGVGEPAPVTAPIVAVPPGAALPLAFALAPLAEAAGLRRVVATVLDAASTAGRAGIQTIYAESLAIFNQEELPEPDVFGRPVAFDCMPGLGSVGEDGATPREREIGLRVSKLLDVEIPLAVSVVQVPAFVGQGVTLAVETERPLDPASAVAAFEKAPGVEFWREDEGGPNVRAAASRRVVLVGRVRPDPSCENGLLLWLAADVLSLVAANGVALAEARFQAR